MAPSIQGRRKLRLKKLILFDLDGTLTESGLGITKSVQYALRKFGIEEPDLEKLRVFVGPPLIEMFQTYAGLDKEQAKQGVVYYREYFQKKGIFENALYHGVTEMLAELKKKGFSLGIASSKPEPYVLQIADYFDIKKYFDVIVGSTMSETRTKKAEVIEEALARYADAVISNFTASERTNAEGPAEENERLSVLKKLRDETVMVGDKSHDILGAREAGIRCIGVLYGYGTKEEIDGASPFAVAETVDELRRISGEL